MRLTDSEAFRLRMESIAEAIVRQRTAMESQTDAKLVALAKRSIETLEDTLAILDRTRTVLVCGPDLSRGVNSVGQ